MIFITSFQRPGALLSLLKELDGEDVVVYDDGSEHDAIKHLGHCRQYVRTRHHGKKEFWRIWRKMFHVAKNSRHDEFIFLQDDLYDIDLEGLRAVETPDKYALNLMDVGPDRGWSPKGYVDCVMKTNRKTLDAINWNVPKVNPRRWRYRPNMSSGVGEGLSKQFYEKDIPMILPDKNYASHGDAESQMHPDLRKQEPLIAQTGG